MKQTPCENQSVTNTWNRHETTKTAKSWFSSCHPKEVYALNNYAFTYAPQIGILFPLKKHSYIDAGIRYEGVSHFYNDNKTASFWGAHIAYEFNL